jgi:hypothetical protein
MIKSNLITIAQALAISAVIGFAAFLAFKGSDWLLVLFASALIGAALMMLFLVRRAIIRGELPGRGSITSRDRSPITFWIGIFIFTVGAFLFFFQGLAFIGLAPHWYIALLRSLSSHH